MDTLIWQSFLAALAGGILSLDRTAAFQVMVSRPVVAAPVIGYILGDAMTGLLIGGVLELFFIGGLPVGGHIPPHEIMLTVIITAVMLIGQNIFDSIWFDMFESDVNASIIFAFGFAILMTMPLDAICKKADTVARFINNRLFHIALADVENGNLKGAGINNLKGAGVFFILSFFTLFILIFTSAMFVHFLLPVLPKIFIMSLPLTAGVVLVLSLSSAYSALYSRISPPVFLSATILTAILLVVIIT